MVLTSRNKWASKALLELTPIALAVLALFGGSLACTKKAPELSPVPNVELIQDMMESPALKAQDHEDGDYSKAASRLPPEGTVPVGYTPYKYKGDPVAAEAGLKNPLAGSTDARLIETGKKHYQVYCAVCHGDTGLGNGPVSVKMLTKPPSLVSEKIQKMKDGGIYHIITDGQGLMSLYADRIVKEEDRWAVVNYVRSLAGQKTASHSSKTGSEAQMGQAAQSTAGGI